MSEACHARSGPRPAWMALYAVAAVALAAAAASELLLPAELGRTVGEVAGALGTFGALGLWVRGNRAALAAEARCCTISITIRVAHPGDVGELTELAPAPDGADTFDEVEQHALV